MEGFTAFVELWVWEENEEIVRQRIKDAFPESKSPSDRGIHAHIVKVVQNTHRPRNQKT